jgi:hypothetical protein
MGSHSSTSSSMKHEDYTVGWICALPTEMAAARGMLDGLYDILPSRPHDNNNYGFGYIGDHNVVVACLPSGVTGTISAARVTTQMLSTFTGLRSGLTVGIGGWVPNEEHDIRLGDVVVSKSTGTFGGVIQYDFGKTIQEYKFIRTGSLNKPPEVLLTGTGQFGSTAYDGKPQIGKVSLRDDRENILKWQLNLRVRLRSMTCYTLRSTTIQKDV